MENLKLVSNSEIVETFKLNFKLKESPIAFFYTDNPPQEIEPPHPTMPETLEDKHGRNEADDPTYDAYRGHMALCSPSGFPRCVRLGLRPVDVVGDAPRTVPSNVREHGFLPGLDS